MTFKSDNIAPIDTHILRAINEVNNGYSNPYARDTVTKRLKVKASDIFEAKVECFCVSTGSISNSLALSALCLPYQTIYCHKNSHVNCLEGGLIESMGHKLSPVTGRLNKIDKKKLQGIIGAQISCRPHTTKPGAISVAQSTEIGTVYTPDEIKALTQYNLPLHIDGARFANALVALNVTPAELTWKAGVDVLSLGATKNGAMMGEMIIFFNKSYAKDFEYRVKRSGQLLGKMRYISAQMIAYFDVWLSNAKSANQKAQELCDVLSSTFELAYPCVTNQVFVHMPKEMAKNLHEQGFSFYNWEKDIYRFVTNFMTSSDEIVKFKTALALF